MSFELPIDKFVHLLYNGIMGIRDELERLNKALEAHWVADGDTGPTLKRLRVKAALSQAQVADRINCNVTYISKIENGRPLSKRMARELLALYQEELSELAKKEGANGG